MTLNVSYRFYINASQYRSNYIYFAVLGGRGWKLWITGKPIENINLHSTQCHWLFSGYKTPKHHVLSFNYNIMHLKVTYSVWLLAMCINQIVSTHIICIIFVHFSPLINVNVSNYYFTIDLCIMYSIRI